MNLQQLYYFEKIASCGQYTRAARDLHITQAALSSAISNLEHELNVRLFDRQGKSLVLTSCGKAYLSCVRDALHALDRGAEMVRNLTAPARASIRILSLESVKALVLGLIADLCNSRQSEQELADQPSFRFELAHYTAPQIEELLLRREADLGIATAPNSPELSSHLLGYQGNVLIVPKGHPWADQASISLSALDKQRFIAYTKDCLIRGYYDAILESAQVEPEIFAESRSHSNIIDMVGYQLGVALIPEMRALAERPDILERPIQDSIPPRAIYLLWVRDAKLSPEAEQLRQRILSEKNPGRYF